MKRVYCVALPAGSVQTNATILATTGLLPDGRSRIGVINPRPDEIDVVIAAQRAL